MRGAVEVISHHDETPTEGVKRLQKKSVAYASPRFENEIINFVGVKIGEKYYVRAKIQILLCTC
jgi:hypothetical protein